MEEIKRVVRIQLNGLVGGMVLDAQADRDGFLDELKLFLDGMTPGEYISITIEEMSTEALAALPEFTGW